MKSTEFEHDGHVFDFKSIEQAKLVDDGEDGTHWEVPCEGGNYETTDEGLRMMKRAAQMQSDENMEDLPDFDDEE